MPLKFPLHPTTSSLPPPQHNSSTTFHHFPHPSHMIFTTTIPPLKFPYSPPSSTLSPPLTPCQSSPPSESDDLCSACKGAGEFVCCDNCPRVFHFLCCDPPRLDAPTGSFLCHDCSAKLKPAEEPAVDSHHVLGPLFRSLESTNTRAFALPFEIQNRFENVAARPDGSYFEETKKFPL